MLTIEELNVLEHCAEPVRVRRGDSVRFVQMVSAFNRAARLYRGLVRSARRRLCARQMLGMNLEMALREGAQVIWASRRRLAHDQLPVTTRLE